MSGEKRKENKVKERGRNSGASDIHISRDIHR